MGPHKMKDHERGRIRDANAWLELAHLKHRRQEYCIRQYCFIRHGEPEDPKPIVSVPLSMEVCIALGEVLMNKQYRFGQFLSAWCAQILPASSQKRTGYSVDL